MRVEVIQPFEALLKMFDPVQRTLRERNKRRLDYEKSALMVAQGKHIDAKLAKNVDFYKAANEMAKIELPKFSSIIMSVGRTCHARFVMGQTKWYKMWTDKIRSAVEDGDVPEFVADILDHFNRDFKYTEARMFELGIVNGSVLARIGSSATYVTDDAASSKKSRPSGLDNRPRGLSIHSDRSPSIPTPDFARSPSSHFTLFSPTAANHSVSSPVGGPGRVPASTSAFQSFTTTDSASLGSRMTRPSTGKSSESQGVVPRMSIDSAPLPASASAAISRPSSGMHYSYSSPHLDNPSTSSQRPESSIFSSALPDGGGGGSDARSLSGLGEREWEANGSGYTVLYLAASLFNFQVKDTKNVGPYPYLTYQAGEVCFDPFLSPLQTRVISARTVS